MPPPMPHTSATATSAHGDRATASARIAPSMAARAAQPSAASLTPRRSSRLASAGPSPVPAPRTACRTPNDSAAAPSGARSAPTRLRAIHAAPPASPSGALPSTAASSAGRRAATRSAATVSRGVVDRRRRRRHRRQAHSQGRRHQERAGVQRQRQRRAQQGRHAAQRHAGDEGRAPGDGEDRVGAHQLVGVDQAPHRRGLGRRRRRGDRAARQEQELDGDHRARHRRRRHRRGDHRRQEVGADHHPAPIGPVDQRAGHRRQHRRRQRVRGQHQRQPQRAAAGLERQGADRDEAEPVADLGHGGRRPQAAEGGARAQPRGHAPPYAAAARILSRLPVCWQEANRLAAPRSAAAPAPRRRAAAAQVPGARHRSVR